MSYLTAMPIFHFVIDIKIISLEEQYWYGFLIAVMAVLFPVFICGLVRSISDSVQICYMIERDLGKHSRYNDLKLKFAGNSEGYQKFSNSNMNLK